MQQPLANRVGSDADSTQIAAAVLAIWEEIDDALTPIVGPLGVVALYRRSRAPGRGAASVAGRSR